MRKRADSPGLFRLWWLSFCDPGLPAGSRFLGACIVSDGGLGLLGAMRTAHRIGCNPGGEVVGAPAPEGKRIPARWRNRLLTRAECEAFNGETGP